MRASMRVAYRSPSDSQVPNEGLPARSMRLTGLVAHGAGLSVICSQLSVAPIVQHHSSSRTDPPGGRLRDENLSKINWQLPSSNHH